jgi:NitT/TauT family transport system substrate-binding protein
VLLLAGCGAASPASPAANSPAASKPLVTFNAAYASAGANALPTVIASSMGFFRQNGLDTTLSYIEGSVRAAPALSNGDVSMVDVAGAAVVQGQLNGLDMVILSVHVANSREHVMAPAAIKDIPDLRGKRIGGGQPGDATDRGITVALKQAGMTPNKEVSVVYFGSQQAGLAALQNGAIEALIVPAPYNSTAEKAGFHEIANLRIPTPADGIVSTRKIVATRQNDVVAFLKAYLQGLRFLRSDPEGSKRVLAQYTKQSDPQVLDQTYNDLLANVEDDPTPRDETVAGALQQIKGAEDKSPAEFVDTAPIKAALAQLR